ncbi:asparagine synthase (glutamine-hydrolyzing) [Achromobacter insuavis]|uniref:asparagine synthase (glutamine-hydrolyzing) n=1 Tax=Achromobacter insuavis TaxID=1287735 RepID=UPI001F133E14|nr:asparagine synthase (glutamine-hydrolyzing) [Achromobacter insuavis]
MCGIAGIVGGVPTLDQLKGMADAMVHRGPDDDGFYLADGVGFAFRRLSIVDIAGGHQPMSDREQSVWVVFNGEIYNHLELRQVLAAKGHVFTSDHSDTEVFVHGWKEWGTSLFSRLNGMFAVAIWDVKARRLVLARDRYGIKPLHYAETASGQLIFGSEIRTVFGSGLVDKRPSPQGIIEYFSVQNLWQGRTMFAAVKQLEAGTFLVRDSSGTRHERYWDLAFPRSRRGSLEELSREHRDILGRSLKRQIAADVPVMSYLSGGIDSTAIAVGAYHLDPNVRAYSCIFDLDGVGDDRAADEREFSRLVAREYSMDRVEMMVSPLALRDCLDGYVSSLEDLRMGMGYVNYLIAERVARDAKVVLSGTGGDEYHAGYIGRYKILGLTGGDHQWAEAPQRISSRIAGWLRNLRSRSSAKPPSRNDVYRAVLNSVMSPAALKNAFTPEFLAQAQGYDAIAEIDSWIAAAPSDDWFDKVFYVDARTYLEGLLSFEDRVSMAHSLEARVPLLDNELVDFVLDLPKEMLAQGDTGKLIFRESVKPWVPEQIYNKPKMGFGPPDASWYRNQLRSWIEKELDPAHIAKQGVFNPAYVSDVLQKHFTSQANNTYLIWSFLNFNAWCRNFGYYGA